MKIKQILEILNDNFPPKEGCSNAIFYTKESNCNIGLMIWISKDELRNFYLDYEEELDDIYKLVEDIKKFNL